MSEYRERLVTDGATEFTGRHTELITEVQRRCIMLHAMEEGRKNENHAAEQR
jgi:hypothetical protein